MKAARCGPLCSPGGKEGQTDREAFGDHLIGANVHTQSTRVSGREGDDLHGARDVLTPGNCLYKMNRTLMNRCSPALFFSFLVLFFSLGTVGPVPAITLDEAVRKAVETSYLMEEQRDIAKRSEYSYGATIDPYLPRADIQTSYSRTLSSPRTVSTYGGTDSYGGVSRDAFAAAGSISYRLFDGGERYARRKGAYSLLEKEWERLKSVREEVVFSMKTAFFTALGKKFIVGERQEALRINQRVYDLTRGRYDEGIAKKSDVLQAEVRVSTAAIDLATAKKDYEKALEDVWSLLHGAGGPRDDVEGDLKEVSVEQGIEKLTERALDVKPEIVVQRKEIERLVQVRNEKQSSWYPKLDAQLQQTRQDRRFFPEGRSDAFMVNMTFPLFDGPGRYLNVRAAEMDVAAARQRLEEIKRSVSLNIVQAYKDYQLSRERVGLFRELVREATVSFDQAFGEYKVGKGDVLTLFLAERDLTQARENLIVSLYQANLALAGLERAAYTGGEGY